MGVCGGLGKGRGGERGLWTPFNVSVYLHKNYEFNTNSNKSRIKNIVKVGGGVSGGARIMYITPPPSPTSSLPCKTARQLKEYPKENRCCVCLPVNSGDVVRVADRG
jgi:hypothetical protein